MSPKTAIKVVVVGAAALIIGGQIIKYNIESDVYKRDYPVVKPDYTSIILPALNEERYIEATLKSIEDQNVRLMYPERFELIVVDSSSTDNTKEIALRHTPNVVQSPHGKLNARDRGISMSKGNIIVAVDADTYYPPNWLNLILRNFREGVVAVGSPRMYHNGGLFLDTVSSYKAVIDYNTNNRMAGSGSAFLKWAYLKCSGFDLNIDQVDNNAILQEEEFGFHSRIMKMGKYIFEWRAPHFTSARRLTIGWRSSF